MVCVMAVVVFVVVPFPGSSAETRLIFGPTIIVAPNVGDKCGRIVRTGRVVMAVVLTVVAEEVS
jgi:hypothetical protein